MTYHVIHKRGVFTCAAPSRRVAVVKTAFHLAFYYSIPFAKITAECAGWKVMCDKGAKAEGGEEC